MSDNADPKPIHKVEILIYTDNKITVSSTIEDQRIVRSVIQTAEEAVIQAALTKASPKSNIVQLNTQILKPN